MCLLSCRILKGVFPFASNEAYQLRISNYIIFEVFGKKVAVGTLTDSNNTIYNTLITSELQLISSLHSGTMDF